ncbi:MAG: CRISPR-associated endonuclease Cas1, partial [Deltaproteobacteria bacterium]|nr:CRISPR-associated endonuclease Cas1 [Deltaproteobacteria bacterium]
MGLEGGAAKTYFSAFGKMILGEFNFTGRNKRPPTDPVNAILSLSYTMIFNEISSLLDGLGFDPYLGGVTQKSCINFFKKKLDSARYICNMQGHELAVKNTGTS